mmetsp:Transcript_2072/g.4585  ORF Transcript_2072/g.4585 Transcript_2072/m.4585 type:complete len:322 (-) Transcript_2072:773-1738(-)
MHPLNHCGLIDRVKVRHMERKRVRRVHELRRRRRRPEEYHVSVCRHVKQLPAHHIHPCSSRARVHHHARHHRRENHVRPHREREPAARLEPRQRDRARRRHQRDDLREARVLHATHKLRRHRHHHQRLVEIVEHKQVLLLRRLRLASAPVRRRRRRLALSARARPGRVLVAPDLFQLCTQLFRAGNQSEVQLVHAGNQKRAEHERQVHKRRFRRNHVTRAVRAEVLDQIKQLVQRHANHSESTEFDTRRRRRTYCAVDKGADCVRERELLIAIADDESGHADVEGIEHADEDEHSDEHTGAGDESGEPARENRVRFEQGAG